MLSGFKSSVRHFEQWANVRKTLAVVVEVMLASRTAQVQGTFMLSICVVALALQARLEPYDDDNGETDL